MKVTPLRKLADDYNSLCKFHDQLENHKEDKLAELLFQRYSDIEPDEAIEWSMEFRYRPYKECIRIIDRKFKRKKK